MKKPERKRTENDGNETRLPARDSEGYKLRQNRNDSCGLAAGDLQRGHGGEYADAYCSARVGVG